MLLLAPPEPADRALAGLFDVAVGCRVLHALIEGHGDVAAQVGLDLHGLLRPHKDPPPVDVGGEGDALLGDLPQSRQGEHLEAAGIRQNGTVPVHHFVEPAQSLHHVIPRPEVEVVGIRQLDLALEVLQIVGADRPLDGSLSAYVHKDGGLDHTAVGA